MKIAKNKVLKIIIILYALSFFIGVISYFFINTTSINNTIQNYFLSFNDEINYTSGLIKTIMYNIKLSSIIWISGILIFGIVTAPLILVIRNLSLGTTISSIIICFRLKGILLSIIIIIINLLYDIIYILISYYSIKQSLRTLKIIKQNQSINIKSFYKNYIIRFIILIMLLIAISLLDTYVISNIIKHIII